MIFIFILMVIIMTVMMITVMLLSHTRYYGYYYNHYYYNYHHYNYCYFYEQQHDGSKDTQRYNRIRNIMEDKRLREARICSLRKGWCLTKLDK